jgi:outer membrane lipoprotein-sorting protein
MAHPQGEHAMTNLTRAVWLSFSTLALASMGFAADLKTADEVIAKYNEARGGLDKIKAIKSVKGTGKMSMGPMELPFSIAMQRPSAMRIDFNFQGMNATQAYDGSKGWQVMPMMGKTDPEPMSEDDIKNISEQADMDGALVDYAKKGHSVKLDGTKDIEGTPAYKLVITKKNGDVETNFIDSEYFILIRTESKMKMQGQEVDSATTLGDYKEVEGVMFPHSITNAFNAGGQEMKQTMTIENYQANVDFPADHFTMPKVEPKAEGAKEAGK